VQQIPEDDVQVIMSLIRHQRGGVNNLIPHTLAEMFGIRYSGDLNIIHGGVFYSLHGWLERGYAEAVEIQLYEADVHVQIGDVRRSAAIGQDLQTCGWSRNVCGNIVGEGGEIIATGAGDGDLELEFIACHGSRGIDGDLIVGETDLDAKGNEICVFDGRRVPMDNLLGFVFREYVLATL
jgi:hypothetical protein